MMDKPDMPVLPLLSGISGALAAALERLRHQLALGPVAPPTYTAREVASHCAGAPALSDRQANVLTDVATGLAELAGWTRGGGDGGAVLTEFLGQEDARRVMKYLGADEPL